MKRAAACFCVLALLVSIGGCGALAAVAGGGLGANEVTVLLTNESDEHQVIVDICYDEDDGAAEAFIREFGDCDTVTLDPNRTITYRTADCDDLQAIFIDDSELQLGFGLGPNEDTEVYRGDGEDFDCGDTITFIFSHNDLPLPTDLVINFSRS